MLPLETLCFLLRAALTAAYCTSGLKLGLLAARMRMLTTHHRTSASWHSSIPSIDPNPNAADDYLHPENIEVCDSRESTPTRESQSWAAMPRG